KRTIRDPQLGYDHLAHRTGLGPIVTDALTWQVLGQKKPVHRQRVIRLHHLRGRGMVDEDVQRSAEELRETAAKLRQLARQTRFGSTRRELMNLAERFERMAAELDGGGSPPQSGA